MATTKSIPRVPRYRHVTFRGQHAQRPLNLAAQAPAHPRLPSRQLSTADEEFLAWLFQRGGLRLDDYRRETLGRRLPACLRALRATSAAEARQRLEVEPALVALAMGTLVIGVTGFFRDAAVFDHLTFSVLPALQRPAGGPRIWSAGCSEGAEAYSVAMLLAEMGMLESASLLGSDCRAQAVARARKGRYEARALRDVPQQWRDKYFIEEGHHFRVCPRLRDVVQWRTADLTRICEPGYWDLILCRNVAMYLRPEAAAQVWTSLEKAIRPGGFLVLGKAERPQGAHKLIALGPCIYRKSRM